MKRSEILDAARKCVCGEREKDYGSPENNFHTIALLWRVYLRDRLKADIRPEDVAAMLALLKIARIASGHAKADNWVDLAGYAACGGEIQSAEDKPATPIITEDNPAEARRIMDEMEGRKAAGQ